MGAVVGAELRQTGTRHTLAVVSEGVPGLAPSGGERVTFADGCLVLICEGSELTVNVRLERHDGEPDPVEPPWRPAGEGRWHLTSGHLAVINLEGQLDWLPDLGLHAGTWNARVSSTGGDEAAALEDRFLEEDDTDWPDGPEQFLVQLWP